MTHGVTHGVTRTRPPMHTNVADAVDVVAGLRHVYHGVPVCSAQCAVCSVQCAVCSVQCAVCSVQCAVCSVQWTLTHDLGTKSNSAGNFACNGRKFRAKESFLQSS